MCRDCDEFSIQTSRSGWWTYNKQKMLGGDVKQGGIKENMKNLINNWMRKPGILIQKLLKKLFLEGIQNTLRQINWPRKYIRRVRGWSWKFNTRMVRSFGLEAYGESIRQKSYMGTRGKMWRVDLLIGFKELLLVWV